MKRDEFESFEVLDSKLDGLIKRFAEFESFEQRIDRNVEKRVLELKFLSYLQLVLLVLVFGLLAGIAARLYLA